MDPKLLAVLFRNLATLAGDPALGYRGSAVVAALQLISVAIELGVAGYEDLQKLASQIDEMIAQGREPTKDEWAELRARSEAAHLILNPPPPPEA